MYLLVGGGLGVVFHFLLLWSQQPPAYAVAQVHCLSQPEVALAGVACQPRLLEAAQHLPQMEQVVCPHGGMNQAL